MDELINTVLFPVEEDGERVIVEVSLIGDYDVWNTGSRLTLEDRGMAIVLMCQNWICRMIQSRLALILR